jgi:hypothetical protein
MPAPKVYNKHHGNPPADAVYIWRGSRHGNIFVIGKDGDRDELWQKLRANSFHCLTLSQLTGRDLQNGVDVW